MQNYSATPRAIIESFWLNRGLIKNLVHREIVGRYKGSVLGIFWSLANPIFMLTIYTFVFGVIFNARWSLESESKTEFALILFSGLLIFNLFSECVTRAPTLILANVNYVKKVVFPLEILPWVIMGGALFQFLVSFTVWIVAYVMLIGMPPWTALLLPFCLVPFALFVMGVSWVLASLGVFLRDVAQITGMFVTVLMYLSPIFFPVSALPPTFQSLIHLNPLTEPIEMVRDLIIWGHVPSLQQWAFSSFISFAVGMMGFAWFQKTRKGFADVL